MTDTSNFYLTPYTIKDAVEALASKNVPRLGETYVCFVHPHQARRLRDTPEWIEVTKYAQPGNFMLGEIGRIQRCGLHRDHADLPSRPAMAPQAFQAPAPSVPRPRSPTRTTRPWSVERRTGGWCLLALDLHRACRPRCRTTVRTRTTVRLPSPPHKGWEFDLAEHHGHRWYRWHAEDASTA